MALYPLLAERANMVLPAHRIRAEAIDQLEMTIPRPNDVWWPGMAHPYLRCPHVAM